MARIKSRRTRNRDKTQETLQEAREEKLIDQGENEFERKVIALYLAIRDRKKVFLTGLIAAVVIFATIIGSQAWMSNRHENSLAAFELIRKKFDSLDVPELPAKREEVRQDLLKELKEYRSDYGSTDGGHLSWVYTARLQADLKNFKDAGEALEKYAADLDNPLLQAHYWQNAAGYFEQAGMDKKAGELYQRVNGLAGEKGQQKNDIFTTNLYHLGRMAEKDGKKDKAIEFYQKALNNLASGSQNAQLKQTIQIRLWNLQFGT